MFAGLEAAQKLDSDAAILIDADLQDPPSLIPQMLEYYEQGYKHIYAKHKTRKGEPFLKTFFAMMFYKVYSRLSGNKNMTKGARDFCLLSREVIAAFLAVKDYRRFTKESLLGLVLKRNVLNLIMCLRCWQDQMVF